MPNQRFGSARTAPVVSDEHLRLDAGVSLSAPRFGRGRTLLRCCAKTGTAFAKHHPCNLSSAHWPPPSSARCRTLHRAARTWSSNNSPVRRSWGFRSLMFSFCLSKRDTPFQFPVTPDKIDTAPLLPSPAPRPARTPPAGLGKSPIRPGPAAARSGG